MTLSNEERIIIKNTIKECLRNKFRAYRPESKHMPFHFSLIGKDRMALFSFIHSLNTTFGTSIFEPVAERIARTRFKTAKKQYVVGRVISEKSQQVIQEIIDNLTEGREPDKENEIKKICEVSRKPPFRSTRPVKADLFLEDENGSVYLIDIKTAKPNISGFKDYKRTLLEWIAIFQNSHENIDANSIIAIPYNPYEPEPYQRWTIRGMIDLKKELLVAEEFWNFLGGEGAYEQVLGCFENAGIELRPEIDEYFSRFK